MRHIRFRHTPEFSLLANFYELNLRTYVRYQDYKGIYFFSLDADKCLHVEVARAFFKIPYLNCRFNNRYLNESFQIRSERWDQRAPQAVYEANFSLSSFGGEVRGSDMFKMESDRQLTGTSSKYDKPDRLFSHQSPVSDRSGQTINVSNPKFTEKYDFKLLNFLHERYHFLNVAVGRFSSKKELIIGKVLHEPWQLYECDYQEKTEELCSSMQLNQVSQAKLCFYAPLTKVKAQSISRLEL
jgi:uncharacterized protein YqjF (DUF2071 family)